ncbi:SGNH/GDSL hydrolase family protein [Mucilaginibacter robiniae]|uniref:SGNH/GDSL hydrolase family protein n=1 Tax=Mucilaginibacter robiniae TaxID=2728022 RepID=A0A7L5E808_9SPHI|nr:SGNH/GDSL hydrolase family protein [Mucilaginibacter robiniae]QJD96486.1 SGNH/GDSL hydrolase family protein [Mucilaginibacter robiniae]
MKYKLLIMLTLLGVWAHAKPVALKYYKANNSSIHYVGRIDFTNPAKPKFWAPGVYMQVRFSGTSLMMDLNDEVLYNKNHNYIEIAVDQRVPYRIQTTGKSNHIVVAEHLSPGIHTATICKDTETNIGYLEMVGLQCAKLLPWVEHTQHKIEFIGNSITCGTGSDQSVVPCGKGVWQDQHNAYMAYGPRVARMLNAQWNLTSYSGIGLIHSCCDIKFTMPDIFDRTNLLQDSLKWNFNKYVPDVVTVCLGQNDGIQDSTAFCSAYVKFIGQLRQHYPQADIVALTSPMGDEKLTAVLKKYILSIEADRQKNGDTKVHHYFFSRQYHSGCDSHPSLEEHGLIAAELGSYLKKLKGW